MFEHFTWFHFKLTKVVNINYKMIDGRPQLLSIDRFVSISRENVNEIVFSCNV